MATSFISYLIFSKVVPTGGELPVADCKLHSYLKTPGYYGFFCLKIANLYSI